MVVVAAQEQEAAEDALHQQGFTPLGLFSRLGKVGCLNAIHRLLQEGANQLVGWFEDGGAHENLQFGYGISIGPPAAEGRYGFLDLGFLGESDVLIALFFLNPLRRAWRLCVLMTSTYWPTSSSKRR